MLNGCFIRKGLFHRLNKGFIPSVDRKERMKRTESYLFALARSSLCVYRIEKLHFLFTYLCVYVLSAQSWPRRNDVMNTSNQCLFPSFPELLSAPVP